MKNFTSHNCYAPDIQVDDWFRIAGFLYRVKDVKVLAAEVELTCYPVHDPKMPLLMYVNMKQIFKIYNQK